MQGKLNVAAALDLQFADNADGAVIEHFEFLIAQAHDRSDNNGVARMHADRIHVFHAADGDRMVRAVAHDLELDFLVSLDGLFDQHLMHRRQTERVGADLDQFLLIVGKSAAGAAQREGRTQDNRVPDMLCRGLGLLEVIGDLRGDRRLADGLAHFLEQLAVLGAFNGGRAGSEEFHMAFPEHALALELHGKVQAGLSADSGNDGIRAFLAQDSGNILQRQGLHVHFVGNGRVRHNGRRVGVDKDHFIAFLFQGKACLGARIVKLGGLADHDRTGTNNQNLVNVCTLCHLNRLLSDTQSVLCKQLPCRRHRPAFPQTVLLCPWTGNARDQ